MAITIDGSANTVAGLAEGGLPDGKILPADLKSSSGTAGNTTYYRGDGAWGTVSTAEQDASTGDYTLTSGNLIIATSGKGIDFSATSDNTASGSTMVSELLDDYEEGHWTPTISYGGSACTTDASEAIYTKIGRLVTVRGRVSPSNDPSTSSTVSISLPFTSSDATGGDSNGACFVLYIEGFDSDQYGWTGFLGDSSNSFEIRRSGTTGAGTTSSSFASSSTNFLFGGTYETT